MGSLVAFHVDFGIAPLFADDARTAAVLVEKYLRRLHHRLVPHEARS